ncbi:MAG TPA: DUF4105 domain-containing protein [Chryseolinea sp.]|jgi:hypothetical protein|nr:DUF4105 domain-containing protein [Chryseolinea sp.]
MKKLLWLLILISFTGKAQLSEQAIISVLTCGPYQGELYSAFGHSAFRIYDPVNNINVACNYGTFDFNQPNFYLNFARGYNLYELSIQDYQRFEAHYIYENRFIHEQVLNLTPEQKQKLFAYLQWNAKPENASYYYDYFYDNCSTKIRDVLREALGEDVIFDESYVKTQYTIRELTDFYLKEQPWGDLGIDIGLGLPMDKKAAPMEYMFLPDYVEAAFDHASIVHHGSTVPLVKEKRITYEAREEEARKRLPHPLYVFSFIAVLAIILTVVDFKRQKASAWFDVALFGTTGLLGILLLVLWFFTNHQAAAKNFNLLWAFPVHFVAAIAMRESRRWLTLYFLFAGILTVLTLVCWPILPQTLHFALIPLVVAIAVRAFIQFYLRNRYSQRL